VLLVKRKIIAVGIAWDWGYDREFVDCLEKACWEQKLSSYLIHSYNIDDVTEKVKQKEFIFKSLFDRASDTNSRFTPFIQQLSSSKTIFVNPKNHSLIAEDKAILHFHFLKNQIPVPHTIILNPHKDEPPLEIMKALENFKKPFVVKPSKGGGGEGVWKHVHSLSDICRIRLEHQDDRYLVQEEVSPLIIDNKRGWIRAYFAYGKVYYCWWNELTHIYNFVTQEEEKIHKFFKKINRIMKKIAAVVNLNFFSSEFVLTEENNLVVVDYVNDPCDMRLKSIHQTGVPDHLVKTLASNIIDALSKELHNNKKISKPSKKQKKR